MTCCADAGPARAGRINDATPSKIIGLVIAASLSAVLTAIGRKGSRSESRMLARLGEVHRMAAAAAKTQAAKAVSVGRSYWILKSSMLLPSAIISIIQRGVLPRPDHVSDGSFGFRNFGSTLG
jgi:hypothetical protein